MYLLLPLFAAAAFALGSMVYKRTFLEGAGVAHAVVVNNVVLGVVFLPLLAFEPKPIPWAQWHQPLLTALTFVAGHWLSVLALRRGDVTVATPLLGAKVIFVALLGRFFFNTHLTPAQWLATGLATAGVATMGFTEARPKTGTRIGFTTLTALASAGSFAMTDTLIQAWGADFGVWSFLSLQFVALGLLSLAALPVFGTGALRAPARAWKWIFAAVGLAAVTAIIITGTIAVSRDAAGVNVVYATRGLWSVVLVWFLGHHLKNTERRDAGRRIMTLRFAGAALILAAVALTVHSAARN